MSSTFFLRLIVIIVRTILQWSVTESILQKEKKKGQKGQTKETLQNLNPCVEDKSKTQVCFWSKLFALQKKEEESALGDLAPINGGT